MLVVKVDDLNNIKVEPEEVHPMYSPVSYNAGYNQALKDIKEAYNGLSVYDVGVKPVTITDKNGKERHGYYDRSHNLLFLSSMAVEFAKDIGITWKEDDKDPFDHTDEPFLCKAEGCSLYGCKHCESYEPDYDNPREGFV